MQIDTSDVNQIVGHYVSKQYHSQFDSPRSEIYTFVEKIQNNRVIYEFYDVIRMNKRRLILKF